MLAAPPVPAWPDKKYPLVYDPFAVTSGAVAATEFYLPDQRPHSRGNSCLDGYVSSGIGLILCVTNISKPQKIMSILT